MMGNLQEKNQKRIDEIDFSEGIVHSSRYE